MLGDESDGEIWWLGLWLLGDQNGDNNDRHGVARWLAAGGIQIVRKLWPDACILHSPFFLIFFIAPKHMV